MARLVVVEATEWVLAMLADGLRAEGHEVTACTTAAEAASAVQRERPDALVYDVELPDQDATWLVKRVRASGAATSKIPVLVVSTEEATGARVQALEAGADAGVTKPYLLKEVTDRLDALLRMRARLAESQRAGADPDAAPPSAIAGALGEVSVGTLLSILEMERRTGRFDVDAGGQKLALGVTRGVVTGARIDGEDAEPLDAVRAMLGVTKGRFAFVPRSAEPSDDQATGLHLGALVVAAERAPKPEVLDEDDLEASWDKVDEEDAAVDEIEPDFSSYRPPS